MIRKDENGQHVLEAIEGNELGLLKKFPARKNWVLERLDSEAREFVNAPHILTFVNSIRRSTIHRPAYPSFIIMKKFGEDGKVKWAGRFLGLFTSSV